MSFDNTGKGEIKMKNATIQTTLLLTLVAGWLPAATFSTLPGSGLVTGIPGQDVGWGFSTTNDSFFQSLSFSQSILINETDPSVGIYTDQIGPQGGPDNFSVDPGQTWSQGFSETNLAGLGFFSIDPGAANGSSDSGLIRVFFNYADSTPGSFDVPFIVQVEQQAAPEPGTYWLILIAAAAVLAGRTLRRRINSAPTSPGR
jgi:hypothetical protein